MRAQIPWLRVFVEGVVIVVSNEPSLTLLLRRLRERPPGPLSHHGGKRPPSSVITNSNLTDLIRTGITAETRRCFDSTLPAVTGLFSG